MINKEIFIFNILIEISKSISIIATLLGSKGSIIPLYFELLIIAEGLINDILFNLSAGFFTSKFICIVLTNS